MQKMKTVYIHIRWFTGVISSESTVCCGNVGACVGGTYQVEGVSTDRPCELLFQHIVYLTYIWTSKILFM